jgi:nucleoid DNA-binding protein
MTHNEMVRKVAKVAGLPASTVGPVLRAFISETKAALLSGQEVRLYGFGVFSVRIAKPRVLFGGRRKTTKRPIVRFKETRHGEIWGGDQDAGNEDGQ